MLGSQLLPESHRWSDKYPDLGSEPLSTEPYISEEYFEAERERVFRRLWLNVGSVSDCPAAGSYFVREVAVCNTSVLIVHGRDGVIRAFHNVCSHRGNKLVWSERGSAKGYFTCCIHGWSYDLQGELRGVMDDEKFSRLEKTDHGLRPIYASVWKGFIFVNFQDEPDETLEQYLDDVAVNLHDSPLEQLPLRFRFDVEERANWKIALDAQNEIYHLPTLGPVHGSFLQLYQTNDQGLTRLSLFEKLGAHTVWTTNPNSDYQSRGLERALLSKAPVSDIQLETDGIFDFYVIFPNLVIGLLVDSMFTFNFWPVAVDQTVWEVRMHLPEPATAADLFVQHFWKARIRDVLAEDIAGHENVHTAISSRAKREIVLQDEEIQIRSFHKTLQGYMQGWDTTPVGS